MRFLHKIEAMYVLPDGTIFVDRWGSGLLINPKDWGGMIMLPEDTPTTTIGPWLGVKGDQYCIFFLRTNSVLEYVNQPPEADLSTAEQLPSLKPVEDVIVVEERPLDPDARFPDRLVAFFEATGTGGDPSGIEIGSGG